MKKLILSILVAVAAVTTAFSQAPQKFTYQAVVRDVVNNPVINHSVSVRISILQGGENGVPVYEERQTVTTNANGLMTLSVGDGTVLSGDFSAIDWANGPYFLKTETDPTGGTNYSIVGTQQLLSVPYALYAGNSAGGFSGSYNDLTDQPALFSGDYNDLTNQPQIPEIPENVSYFQNDAGYITMDSVPEIPENLSAFNNDAGYLTSVDCGNINICDLLAELQAQIEDLQHTVDSLSGHGEEETPVDAQPCPGTPTVTDVDGNVYNTVWIGQQCWMRENLRTTRYADNTEIPILDSYSVTDLYRCAPASNESNVDTYGYLYNWAAVMHGRATSNANHGVQGVCPNGWHVPSNVEWDQLIDYVSSQSQYVCGSNTRIAKSLASITGWESCSNLCSVSNTPSTNNATGFSALSAGCHIHGGSYQLGNYAYFWSATENSSSNAYSRMLSSCNSVMSRNNSDKNDGYSVRCLRDDTGGSSSIKVSTITTATIGDITATSAACGGNVADDGGGTVTARGVCWSTSQYPTVSDNHTIDGIGTGSFTSSIMELAANTPYYVRAYATNSEGTAYGNEVSFTTLPATTEQDAQPCPGTPTLTDIDGNVYNTVQIGNQCWMRENLRTTHYADNTEIPAGSDMSISYTDPERYIPNDNEGNVSTYGYLYNWKAVMRNSSSSSTNPSGVQGICPTGWHVPSDAEWTQLTNYVSNQSQYVCGSNNTYIAKALASTTGWDSSSSSCAVGNTPSSNNATGFSALPAGECGVNYSSFGSATRFWSATDAYVGNAYYRTLGLGIDYVDRHYINQNYSFSVRCLRD